MHNFIIGKYKYGIIFGFQSNFCLLKVENGFIYH